MHYLLISIMIFLMMFFVFKPIFYIAAMIAIVNLIDIIWYVTILSTGENLPKSFPPLIDTCFAYFAMTSTYKLRKWNREGNSE